jgi:CheY-like chemotaxis protein
MESHKQLTNARFLIVEDDENNRLVTIKLLQVEGVSPTHIYSCEEDPLPYLESLLPQLIDLILLDLQLPGKDGFTILQELHAHPTFAHIPIVALTANVMQDDVRRAQEVGFHSFLGKPINATLFSSRIQQILHGEPVWAPT